MIAATSERFSCASLPAKIDPLSPPGEQGALSIFLQQHLGILLQSFFPHKMPDSVLACMHEVLHMLQY